LDSLRESAFEIAKADICLGALFRYREGKEGHSREDLSIYRDEKAGRIGGLPWKPSFLK
jgi:hypothetical protein